MTYTDETMNGKLSNSTLQNLYENQCFFPCMEVLLIESRDLSKQDKQIEVPRQTDSLSRKLVPLEQFHQTRCLGMLILLINLLRQTITISGEFVPHRKISQTSGVIHLIRFLFFIQSVFRMKENHGQLLRYFFL